MDIDEATIIAEVNEGTLHVRLEAELIEGFEQMARDGEPLPVPSHYASRIAEILHRSLVEPLPPTIAFDLYQEVLIACERARASVLGETLDEQ
ncbi:MAG TPA: hypothetical protein VMT00_11800 [Thermoanaerobaculia bacterium]|nr:hypothetical protein [Thermoanaerobaculia bacterium]